MLASEPSGKKRYAFDKPPFDIKLKDNKAFQKWFTLKPLLISDILEYSPIKPSFTEMTVFDEFTGYT